MDIYLKVSNFSDLLKTNLMFFNGELQETYYYGAPWGKGEDQNDHALVSTKNLVELTEKYRIFTTNGQSSYNDFNTDQRSYLIFYIENKTYEKISNNLLNDKRIWCAFIFRKNKNICDIFSIVSSLNDKKRVVLTKDCGNPYSIWTCNGDAREYDETFYENINEIVKNTIYCIIICKEWNKEPTADSILLEHLHNLEETFIKLE